MKNWISVKDKLPEEKRDVLIHEKFADLCVFVGYLRDDKWIVDKSFISIMGEGYAEDNIEQTYITHWQPLPEPPKL